MNAPLPRGSMYTNTTAMVIRIEQKKFQKILFLLEANKIVAYDAWPLMR